MGYSAEQVIKALQRTKGMIYLAAEELACSPQTIYNHIDRHPTVKAALTAETEKLLDIAELKLADAMVARESWAVKYLLSTKGKNRGYVESATLKVSGDRENPLVIARALSPEQRQARLDELLVKTNGHEVEVS